MLFVVFLYALCALHEMRISQANERQELKFIFLRFFFQANAVHHQFQTANFQKYIK